MDVARVLQCFAAQGETFGRDEEWINLIPARRTVCTDLIVERDDIVAVVSAEQHTVTGVGLSNQRVDGTQYVRLGPKHIERILAVSHFDRALTQDGASGPTSYVHAVGRQSRDDTDPWVRNQPLVQH